MGHIRSQELVDSALLLSDIGLIDADNALVHGVAVQTIRRWRREYQRKARPRGQPHTSVPCPRCEGADLDEAAFAHLLGWYLGDGHISEGRRGVLALHIFNDRRYPTLNAEIADTMRAVKPGGRAHTRLLTGAVVTTVSWKHWSCLFPQHGPGRKHERPIVLADWQREIVVRHPGRFVRGLFHSDGCRITNWIVRTVAGRPKRYEYPRYFGQLRVRRHRGAVHVGARPARRRLAAAAAQHGLGGPPCGGGRARRARWPEVVNARR